MIYIDRIYDTQLPEIVVGELWDYLKDDSEIYPEDYQVPMDEDHRWYVSIEDNEVIGVYYVHRVNHITWQIHTHVRKKHWGSGKTVPHAKAIVEFVFNETGAHKLIATIPESAPQVLDYAKHTGFIEEGRRTSSYMKDGKIYDEILLGITRK